MGKIKWIWAERSAYIRRYLWPLPKFRREVVVMVDGKLPHGGLTDRLRNILSVYSYCKGKGIRFRIHYVYPCPLTSFLLPAGYDWRISSGEVSYHFLDSRELDLYVKELPGSGDGDSPRAQEYNNSRHLAALDEELGKGRKIQYHVYGNSYFANGKYKPLFEELFRPSPFLEDRISRLQDKLAEPYESVTLRFQMLLGDLDEGSFEKLDAQEQEELMDRCSGKIEELWESHYFSTPKVLVTSDSARFLSRISGKEFIYTIPGAMEHMDHTHNPDLDINSKPFLDLFFLMQSRRLTQIITGKMYRSGFPIFAAELGDKPYEEIVFGV